MTGSMLVSKLGQQSLLGAPWARSFSSALVARLRAHFLRLPAESAPTCQVRKVSSDGVVEWSTGLVGAGEEQVTVLVTPADNSFAAPRVFAGSHGNTKWSNRMKAFTCEGPVTLIAGRTRDPSTGVDESFPEIVDVIYVGGGGAVSCLDQSSGQEIWSTVLPATRGSVVAVLPPETVDEKYLFATAYGKIFRLGAKTGEVEWKVKYKSSEKCVPTLCKVGSCIIAGMHGRLVALLVKDGSVVWEQKLPKLGYTIVPMVNGGKRLYCVSGGHAIAFSIEKGEVQKIAWQARLTGIGAAASSLCLGPNGILYIGSGGCVAALRGDTGDILWCWRLAKAGLGLPAILPVKGFEGIYASCGPRTVVLRQDGGVREPNFLTMITGGRNQTICLGSSDYPSDVHCHPAAMVAQVTIRGGIDVEAQEIFQGRTGMEAAVILQQLDNKNDEIKVHIKTDAGCNGSEPEKENRWSYISDSKAESNLFNMGLESSDEEVHNSAADTDEEEDDRHGPFKTDLFRVAFEFKGDKKNPIERRIGKRQQEGKKGQESSRRPQVEEASQESESDDSNPFMDENDDGNPFEEGDR